jgi:hypothetical protein
VISIPSASYLLQQSRGFAQQAGFGSAATCASAAFAQQSAVQLSQQPHSHDAGSQVQTPVEQQPQQSQGTLQAQLLSVPTTLPTATAPPIIKARNEPTRNLNIASNSKRENSARKPLCLSAEAQRRTPSAVSFAS